LAEEPALAQVQLDHLTATAAISGGPAELAAVLKRLIDRGLPVCAFAPRGRNLEDLFLHVTEGKVQ
jgi:ABC-2 type transport system ATP-binding protein